MSDTADIDKADMDTADTCAAVAVLANDAAYRARPEPEQEFTGLVRYLEGTGGPGGRYLPYRLDDVPLYVPPGMNAYVKPFVGQSVLVVGKSVNVGFGGEVWPGTVQRVCP